MTLFDTHYVMPNYLPPGYLTGKSVYSPNTSVLLQYGFSFLKVVLGMPLILLHIGSPNLAFGAGFWGTAASSALVSYTLLLPYLGLMLFMIPGTSGVPPAYRFFSFFIANSGIRKIRNAQSSSDHAENLSKLMRANRNQRFDKYQALLEAEELEDIANFISNDIHRLAQINQSYESLLLARTNAKIAAARKESDVLVGEVKAAKMALRHAQSTPSPSSIHRNSNAARRFANRDGSKQDRSTTAAEAERNKAQADALNAVREAYRLQVQREEWEKRKNE